MTRKCTRRQMCDADRAVKGKENHSAESQITTEYCQGPFKCKGTCKCQCRSMRKLLKRFSASTAQKSKFPKLSVLVARYKGERPFVVASMCAMGSCT
mmetsp:Transcript_87321/g.145165  ORF Transcript_87321/g.145165 Transcript_87321/m.145165 type:complete len:97 (-) Transcript_87321:161-451(-)